MRGVALVLVLLTGSVVGCGGGEGSSRTPATQDSVTAEASLMEIGNEPNLPPSATAQPREMMTRFLAKWGGTTDTALGVREARRSCADGTMVGCAIELSARPDLGDFGPRDYSSNGRLLARLRNIGTKTEKQFDLAPGDSAFVFATPDSVDARNGYVLRRALAYYPTSHRWVERRYLECPPHSPDSDNILAKFRSCPFPAGDKAMFEAWQPGSPFWFKCSDGCCTVN